MKGQQQQQHQRTLFIFCCSCCSDCWNQLVTFMCMGNYLNYYRQQRRTRRQPQQQQQPMSELSTRHRRRRTKTKNSKSLKVNVVCSYTMMTIITILIVVVVFWLLWISLFFIDTYTTTTTTTTSMYQDEQQQQQQLVLGNNHYPRELQISMLLLPMYLRRPENEINIRMQMGGVPTSSMNTAENNNNELFETTTTTTSSSNQNNNNNEKKKPTTTAFFETILSSKVSGMMTESSLPLFEIVFQQPKQLINDPSIDIIHRKFALPIIRMIDNDSEEGGGGYSSDDLPDYGGLQIKFLEEIGSRRQIVHDVTLFQTEYRSPTTPRHDDVIMYYAFDDDLKRSHYTAYNEDGIIDSKKQCRRTSDHRLNLQNCNNLHEINLLESHINYLSVGAYRQVWVLDHEFSNNNNNNKSSEKIIIKNIRYDSEIKYDNFEYVRMDAIVAERLTSSPRIFDIYGFCGLSILSEFFPHGDLEEASVPNGDGYRIKEEDEEEAEIDNRIMMKNNTVKLQNNNLTAMEKLRVATQMAEALVDLHGNRNGVIVHGDVQPSQYLYTADKSIIKLNDFNRAEFMLWDDEEEEYCLYKNGKGGGNWRSPEEYFDAPLDEKLDVWSVGNNFYALLTGLWVFYDEEDDSEMQHRVMKGETAYIDPRYRTRSLAEGKLVQAIEKCLIFEPDDRPSIFEIASFLRKSLTEVEAAERSSKAKIET